MKTIEELDILNDSIYKISYDTFPTGDKINIERSNLQLEEWRLAQISDGGFSSYSICINRRAMNTWDSFRIKRTESYVEVKNKYSIDVFFINKGKGLLSVIAKLKQLSLMPENKKYNRFLDAKLHTFKAEYQKCTASKIGKVSKIENSISNDYFKINDYKIEKIKVSKIENTAYQGIKVNNNHYYKTAEALGFKYGLYGGYEETKRLLNTTISNEIDKKNALILKLAKEIAELDNKRKAE